MLSHYHYATLVSVFTNKYVKSLVIITSWVGFFAFVTQSDTSYIRLCFLQNNPMQMIWSVKKDFACFGISLQAMLVRHVHGLPLQKAHRVIARESIKSTRVPLFAKITSSWKRSSSPTMMKPEGWGKWLVPSGTEILRYFFGPLSHYLNQHAISPSTL